MDVRGVGQQVRVSSVGVGRAYGLEKLRGAVLTVLGGVGQHSLVVSLKLLLLLLPLLLSVPLHLCDQRVPLPLGHPPKLHRWTMKGGKKRQLENAS